MNLAGTTMKRLRSSEGSLAEEKHVAFDPFHRPLDGSEPLTPYLQQPVVIKPDVLFDDAGFAVMMPWETPLMVRQSLACKPQLPSAWSLLFECACATQKATDDRHDDEQIAHARTTQHARTVIC